MRDRVQFGRVFRLMGLPFWTLIGVGLSGVAVNYIGVLLEVPIRQLLSKLHINEIWIGVLTPFMLLVIVLLIIFTLAVYQKQRQQKHEDLSPGPLAMPSGKRGLVISVSRVESAMHAIKYHYINQETLEYVWLIPSGNKESEFFGPSSIEEAMRIQELCKILVQEQKEKTGILRPLLVPEWHREVSPAEAQDTYDFVNRIYRSEATKYNLDATDIIVDFTGGTKPMSVGMVMSCLKSDRSLEYVAYDPESKTMYGPFLIDYQYSAFDLIG